MKADEIARLWLAVTAAAEAEDVLAFQLAFWRLDGGLQRGLQELWETRPREGQLSFVSRLPERARAKRG
jgi:hypothetical protein